MKQLTWAIVFALVAGVALASWSSRRAASDVVPDMHGPAAPHPPAQPKPSAPVVRAAPPAANASPAAEALREVEALVGQGKIGAARDLAEAQLKRIPDGPEAARIKSLTGVHPHP